MSWGSPVGSGACIFISLGSAIGPSKTNFAPSLNQTILSSPELSESGYKLIPAGDFNSISPVKTVDDRIFSFPCDKSLKATLFLHIYILYLCLLWSFLISRRYKLYPSGAVVSFKHLCLCVKENHTF